MKTNVNPLNNNARSSLSLHMLFTLDTWQTLNLFEHSQVYRQAAEHLRMFLNRVRKPYSARASVYTNWASIRERLQTVFANNARLVLTSKRCHSLPLGGAGRGFPFTEDETRRHFSYLSGTFREHHQVTLK